MGRVFKEFHQFNNEIIEKNSRHLFVKIFILHLITQQESLDVFVIAASHEISENNTLNA